MKRIVDNIKQFLWCIRIGLIMLIMTDKDWAELDNIGGPYGRGEG